MEQDAIKRLAPLVAERLAELHDGIAVRNRGGLLAGVEAVAHANNGEMWMGLIASQIAEMRRTEAVLLSRRLETAAASTRRMKVIIAFGNALAVFILLVKGLVIHKEIGRRNLAEQNLKHVNRMLEQKTVELSETNVEVESFAYSVAHDLRAPLRHISGFSNVLMEDYGPRIDAEGQRYLKKISDGAQKMGHLVDDLLSLSKVGRQERHSRIRRWIRCCAKLSRNYRRSTRAGKLIGKLRAFPARSAIRCSSSKFSSIWFRMP